MLVRLLKYGIVNSVQIDLILSQHQRMKSQTKKKLEGFLLEKMKGEKDPGFSRVDIQNMEFSLWILISECFMDKASMGITLLLSCHLSQNSQLGIWHSNLAP